MGDVRATVADVAKECADGCVIIEASRLVNHADEAGLALHVRDLDSIRTGVRERYLDLHEVGEWEQHPRPDADPAGLMPRMIEVCAADLIRLPST